MLVGAPLSASNVPGCPHCPKETVPARGLEELRPPCRGVPWGERHASDVGLAICRAINFCVRTAPALGKLGPLEAVMSQTHHVQWGYDSTCLFNLGAAFWINPFGLVPACFDP